ALLFDVAKLRVSLWVWLGHQALDMRLGADLVFVEHLANRLATEAMATPLETTLEPRETPCSPSHARGGVASHVGLDEVKHGGFHLFFPPQAARPPVAAHDRVAAPSSP